MTKHYDAVVVGSGPNGLAAAITLAQAGCSVLVVEGKETIGGGLRSAELTLPGFIHDPCSAVHPLGMGSPFFRSLPLERFGLRWIQPDAPLAHPLGSGEADAVLVERSLDATAARLGVDAGRYRLLMQPLVENWEDLLGDLLGPLRVPRHPLLYARFGATAILPATALARSLFKAERARAVFAGLASHSIMPLERPLSAAFGLTLGLLAHGVGWPIPAGGSQRVTDALVGYFQSLGGDLVTGWMVQRLDELPKASAYLFDITPRQLVADHRRAAAVWLPATARTLSLRPRRLQSRSGAGRADPVGGSQLRVGGHGTRRRHAGRDRGGRAGSLARPAP